MTQTNAIFTSPMARMQSRMNATQTAKQTATTQSPEVASAPRAKVEPTTTGRTTSNDNSDAAVMARMLELLSK